MKLTFLNCSKSIKKLIVALCVCFFFFSCVEKRTEYYPDGKVKKEWNVVDGMKNGKMTTYYPNGGVERIDFFKSDTLNGESIFFFKSGSISKKINYKNGAPNGDYKFFFKNGILAEEGYLFNGYRKGLLQQYYPSGNLHFKSYVIPVDNESVPYWLMEYDSAGSLVKDDRDIKFQFEKESFREDEVIKLRVILVNQFPFDSSAIEFVDFEESFQFLNRVDWKKKFTNSQLEIEILPKKKGKFSIHGKWNGYKRVMTKDTIYDYNTYSFFEEIIKVY